MDDKKYTQKELDEKLAQCYKNLEEVYEKLLADAEKEMHEQRMRDGKVIEMYESVLTPAMKARVRELKKNKSMGPRRVT